MYLGDDLQGRIRHRGGPVLVDAMAAAVDHQVAAARSGGGQVLLQAGPVRAELQREAPGGAEHHDRDVRERPGGGAQFPQHRGARRSVAAAQLITPAVAGEPERLPGQARQAVGHLLMRGIDQHQPRHQVRPAPGQQLTKIPPQLCPQDLQMYITLAVLPTWTAFFILPFLLRNPSAPWVVVASIFPPTAPLVMLSRMGLTAVPAWQMGLSVLLLVLEHLGGSVVRVAALPHRHSDVRQARYAA